MDGIEKAIQESDIVIAMNSKSKKLFSSLCRVYVKDKEELRQVGLIRNVQLRTNSDDTVVDLKISFPLEKEGMSDQVKKSLRESTSLLAEKGCLIELSDHGHQNGGEE